MLTQDLNRRTRAALLFLALLAVCNLALGGLNAFSDNVAEEDFCQERIVARDNVRRGFVGTQGTLVRFSQADVAEKNGVDSDEYRSFDQRASRYMIAVRADGLKLFPPVSC